MSETECTQKSVCLVERQQNGTRSEIVLLPGMALVIWNNGIAESGKIDLITDLMRQRENDIAYYLVFLEDGKTVYCPEGWGYKRKSHFGCAYEGETNIAGELEFIEFYLADTEKGAWFLRERLTKRKQARNS